MLINWIKIPTLLTLIFLIIILSAGYVTAQDGTETVPPKATFLTIDYQEKSDKSGVFTEITAKLIGDDGRAIGGKRVTFFIVEDYFGLNSVILGTANTNAAGNASIRYETNREGAHQIEAVFTGDEDYLNSKVISSIEITSVKLIEPESIGLQPIHNAGLVAVGVIVICVWLLLLFVLYQIFFSIRRSHSSTT